MRFIGLFCTLRLGTWLCMQLFSAVYLSTWVLPFIHLPPFESPLFTTIVTKKPLEKSPLIVSVFLTLFVFVAALYHRGYSTKYDQSFYLHQIQTITDRYYYPFFYKYFVIELNP